MDFEPQANNLILKVTASGDSKFSDLVSALMSDRATYKKRLIDHGVILFRGFEAKSSDDLMTLVTKGMGFKAWNTFNFLQLPTFLIDKIRRYSESLLGGGDYRIWLDKNSVQLGPADQGVQGPHVEGGLSTKRARFLVIGCFEAPKTFGETGVVDLEKCFSELPDELKLKYRHASNLFSFAALRKLTSIEKLFLKLTQFKVTTDTNVAKLNLPPCPLTLAVPETGKLCLQPWPFARNTADAVRAAAQVAFKDRGAIEIDRTSQDINLSWELRDQNGQIINWTHDDQVKLFTHIFTRAHLLRWQKGDVILVDNLRVGHFRMNGSNDRRLVQIQTESFSTV